MTNSLYSGLISQGVNFGDDYRHWKKPYMIDKLCLVMGVKDKKDPDPTYVLTVDNLIKMLAIQMRFRCGIPVVIMGETGCGKTRLIRYMCDLALSGRGGKNIFIMKVCQRINMFTCIHLCIQWNLRIKDTFSCFVLYREVILF